MKSIVAQLLFLLLPIFIFIIVFYVSGILMSSEIKIIDFSSKISKMINEFETYKQTISNLVKEKRSEFSLSTEYLIIEVKDVEVKDNKITYSVFGKPKEKLEGIDFVIFYYAEDRL
ncbi:MAG: hypothetical protein QW197_01905 [Candidatus Aenigmatarchaeota archaeon]